MFLCKKATIFIGCLKEIIDTRIFFNKYKANFILANSVKTEWFSPSGAGTRNLSLIE